MGVGVGVRFVGGVEEVGRVGRIVVGVDGGVGVQVRVQGEETRNGRGRRACVGGVKGLRWVVVGVELELGGLVGLVRGCLES